MTTAPAFGRAFGVDLAVGFRFPGLHVIDDPVDAVPVGLAARRDLIGSWPAGSERLSSRRGSHGRVISSWDAHPEHGYLLQATGYGCFLVGPAGEVACCAPARVPTWRWQRYLVGQILPLLALLHGFELFHASVVEGNGHAISIMGASGAGKSSLAAALVLRGGRYVADDVLAVRPNDVLRAHPSPALTTLRRDAAERLAKGELERLGSPIGHDQHEVRLVVDVATEPVAITGVYVLARDRAAKGTTIRDLKPVDPRILLTASYNFLIRDPDRLIRQLDTCVGLSESVAIHQVTIGDDTEPKASAAAVAAHAGLP